MLVLGDRYRKLGKGICCYTGIGIGSWEKV